MKICPGEKEYVPYIEMELYKLSRKKNNAIDRGFFFKLMTIF